MALLFTPAGCRALALATALALPGLALAQQKGPVAGLATFAAKAKAQGLSAADVADPIITSSYLDASTGLTHTYLQQRVNGLAVFNATGAVHTDATGKVVLATQDFVAGAAAKANSPSPALTPAQAVTAAAVALDLPRPVALRTVTEARVADGVIFNNGGISQENIPVRLMYTRQDGKLVLVWNVTIAQLDQQHHWNARVDAQTGRLVEQNDYVVAEAATFSEVLQRQSLSAAGASAAARLAAPAGVRQVLSPNAAGSLTVFPVPLESPSAGSRQAVPLSSANPTYSPYGWQVSQAPAGTFPDSYSLAPSGKFLTRGNNVAAYDDNSNTVSGAGNANYNSPTSSPDGGPTLNFDFPFDQANGPRPNLNAATTNLFYWNNMVHDVMMAHGFSEAAGNFQFKNASGAGAGNDPVRAESQDGSGRNNANFGTPSDGSSPTMQMYLWDNSVNTLTITAPSSIAGTYTFGTASFGPKLSSLPNGLCGNIVPINDGVSPDGGIHSCAATVNAAALAGNIALIQRGGCVAPASNNFSAKVKFAQQAGAIGAIIFDSNLSTTRPLQLGGTDSTVTIPAIGISGVTGAKIRAALTGNTVGVGCAKTVVGAAWDGSFDNGVVSHEYGHGISNRLTGGPANSSCVIQSYTTDGTTFYTQTMGEGWSDFFGLWMTTQPTDVGSTPHYIASYLSNGTQLVGPGIRSYPYSTNLSVDPLTYGVVGTVTAQDNYTETHALGEVWAATLWDLNWQFIAKYGYNADMFAATTGGNNKMLKLVLDACKIQVCNPGFLDGRDALLRADTLTNRAANAALIWNVFARRGMGFGAVQGDRVNGTPRLTGIKEAFALPPNVAAVVLATKNGATTGSALEAFPNPAQDLLTVRTQLSSTAPMRVALLDLMGRTVLQATAPTAQMQQAGIGLNISGLSAGLYVVRVTTTEGTYSTKVTIQH